MFRSTGNYKPVTDKKGAIYIVHDNEGGEMLPLSRLSDTKPILVTSHTV